MKRRSVLFCRDPKWHDRHGVLAVNLPGLVHSWLWETGSLTRRLRSVCHGDFRVNLARQTWGKPFTDESRALHLPYSRYALIREVELQCDRTSLVLARTIIPAATLKGVNRRLARLGSRPLGEVIFSDPRLVRLGFEITCIEPDNWVNAQMTENLSIWGRRSRYSIGSGQLLVCEFFLPPLYRFKQKGNDEEQGF